MTISNSDKHNTSTKRTNVTNDHTYFKWLHGYHCHLTGQEDGDDSYTVHSYSPDTHLFTLSHNDTEEHIHVPINHMELHYHFDNEESYGEKLFNLLSTKAFITIIHYPLDPMQPSYPLQLSREDYVVGDDQFRSRYSLTTDNMYDIEDRVLGNDLDILDGVLSYHHFEEWLESQLANVPELNSMRVGAGKYDYGITLYIDGSYISDIWELRTLRGKAREKI